MVQWMATGADATKPQGDGSLPVIHVIWIKDPKSTQELVEVSEQVRTCLSRGQAVAVQTVHADLEYQWNSRDISLLVGSGGGDTSTIIEWQCKLYQSDYNTHQLNLAVAIKGRHKYRQQVAEYVARTGDTEGDHAPQEQARGGSVPDTTVLHERASVTEFLAAAEDPTDCVNMLDFVQHTGWAPPLIK